VPAQFAQRLVRLSDSRREPDRQRDTVRNKSIVVADDSPAFLEMLVLTLGEVPSLEVVAAARDGVEAVEAAVELRADAALLDVDMPRLDGFDAASEIRRLCPQTELVLHTALMSDEHRRRGEQLDLRVYDKFELSRTIESLKRALLRTNAIDGCARHGQHRVVREGEGGAGVDLAQDVGVVARRGLCTVEKVGIPDHPQRLRIEVE
jgi:CheY-like chemotaxis protein